MSKYSAGISFLALFICLSSCQKKYIGPELSYGTLFNLLQKMVVSSDAGVTTHSFTYNTSGQVLTHNILLKGKNPVRTENSLAQYYRNSSGYVDSIKITVALNGTVSAIKKMYFSYSSGSRVAYSILINNSNDPSAERDSSVYQYNGYFLIERKDYIATGAADYGNTFSRQLTFQYSGANITNLIFANTVAGSTDMQTTLISYSYDTSKAALPVNGFQYCYDSVRIAYHEYAAANNLLTIKYGDGSSAPGATYQYSYLTNGKPFSASLRETDAAGGALVSKITFFYD